MASSTAQPGPISIVWFRIGDLRLIDHDPMHQAITSGATHVIPFFCLDDMLLMPPPPPPDKAGFGLPGLGPHRLAALLRAIRSLRDSLIDLGSDLISCTGSTAISLHQVTTILAQSHHPSSLDLHYYPSLDQDDCVEIHAVESFLQAAHACGIPARARPSLEASNVLYQPDDILSNTSENLSTRQDTEHTNKSLESVFKLLELKPTMTDFRSTMQRTTAVRLPLPMPSTLPPMPPSAGKLVNDSSSLNILDLDAARDDGWRDIYSNAGAEESLIRLEKLVGYHLKNSIAAESTSNSPSHVQILPIGEVEVQERLHGMFQGGMGRSTPFMDTYKDSRMMAGNSTESSAVLSAALSLGTVSPRTVYWETLHAMLEAQKEQGVESRELDQQAPAPAEWCWSEPTKASPGHHWLLMHLGIRDFFTYYSLKAGKSLRLSSGPSDRSDLTWSQDQSLLSRWVKGQTGFPYVDASMRELSSTGWVSNRGRQNAASFLSKALCIDWRFGAEIFQSLLIDHDAGVNWGNWSYVTGVGADPRDRHFRTVTQGEKYDPNGEYIAAWVPELKALPARLRHRPWERVPEEQGAKEEELLLSKYPAPIIDPGTQIAKGPRKK